tara:strand:- start:370 stop:3405 length:3036 start_codon:yes stop_codon:yes gene_type:complete
MSASYNHFVSNQTQKVTNNGNHHFLATAAVSPLSTIGQLGLFLPSEMKRTFDGFPKSSAMTSELEDEELIELLNAALRTLTRTLTQSSVNSVGTEFEIIDAMNELIDEAERNRNEGNTDAMKNNIRQLYEACLRLDVHSFGGTSTRPEKAIKTSILDISAKYAHFVVPTTQAPTETKETTTPRNIKDIEGEIERVGAMNRLIMYKNRRRVVVGPNKRRRITVSARSKPGSNSRRPPKRKQARRQRPGTKVRVTLNNRKTRGDVAKLLAEGPRNLILHLQSVSSYTFMVKGGNRPKFASISRADATIEPVLFMDKPSQLAMGMLVQVKYVNKPWWTAKFMESPADEIQLKDYLKEIKRPLAALQEELAELRRTRELEKTGPNRPKWMALNRSSVEGKKEDIIQYKNEASRKYKQFQRGTYVVEDDVAAFEDQEKKLKMWVFVPDGDNSDEWKFPDCPLVTMESDIEILNREGVWQRVEVTQIGDTNNRATDPEHIVLYKYEEDPPDIARRLDTWFQQYRLVSSMYPDDKQDDNNYVYNSEKETNSDTEDNMDEVWEHVYNVNVAVVLDGQRGTVSKVDEQNRSYTINFGSSAVANVQEDELSSVLELHYEPGHIVLYNFRVCRILNLNAHNYTLEQSILQCGNIEALWDAFQAPTNTIPNWNTFVFTDAIMVTGITDIDLQDYCLIQEQNGLRSVCKKNGVTKRDLKLINESGGSRKIRLHSKNIIEQEDVDDMIEEMFVPKQDDLDRVVHFEVGQLVEVYIDNGDMDRPLATLEEELAELNRIRIIEKSGPNRPKWNAEIRNSIGKKEQEINQYKQSHSDQWPIGKIVEHKPNKVQEQESYRVNINGTIGSYNVSQLGQLLHAHPPETMSGACRLAVGLPVNSVPGTVSDDEYTPLSGEEEDDLLPLSADEADQNDSGMETEWVPIADVGVQVKLRETGEILSVTSIDFGVDQTQMSDGNKYDNDEFEIYLPVVEPSSSDDAEDTEDDSETDSSSDETAVVVTGTYNAQLC